MSSGASILTYHHHAPAYRGGNTITYAMPSTIMPAGSRHVEGHPATVSFLSHIYALEEKREERRKHDVCVCRAYASHGKRENITSMYHPLLPSFHTITSLPILQTLYPTPPSISHENGGRRK